MSELKHEDMKALVEAELLALMENESIIHKVQGKIFNLAGYVEKTVAERQLAAAREDAERMKEELNHLHKKELARLHDEISSQCKEMECQQEKMHRLEKDLLSEKYEMSEKICCLEEELKLSKKELKAMRKYVARYQENYGSLDYAYSLYQSLSDNQRFSLGGFFGDDGSMKGFLSGILQRENLEDFWEYIARAIVGDRVSQEEGEKLSRLFDFAFDMVNRSGRLPLYVRIAPDVDDNFDRNIMDCVPGSPRLGSVRCVLFAGYAHRESGRTVKRSLVELR